MKNSIPNWKLRQKHLYAKEGRPNPASLSEMGSEYLKNGFIQDAFEYFSEAKDITALNALESRAVQEGDAFLLAAVEKVTGNLRTEEAWNSLGYKAFEMGKIEFAKKAFERTQNELMLAKIKNDSQPS